MQRLISNAGPIAHLSGHGPISGHIQDLDLLVSEPGMAILVDDHVITKIGESDEMLSEYSGVEVIDIEGRAIIPGLVDSHAHLIWAGDRSREV